MDAGRHVDCGTRNPRIATRSRVPCTASRVGEERQLLHLAADLVRSTHLGELCASQDPLTGLFSLCDGDDWVINGNVGSGRWDGEG